MSIRRGLAWPGPARRLAAALYFATLNWLLLAPASAFEEVDELLPHQDKLVHAGVFLALAFLARWALAAEGRRPRARLALFAALLLYAAAIEALQPSLGGAGRQFDWLDMACNLGGAGAGWLFYAAVLARAPAFVGADRAN